MADVKEDSIDLSQFVSKPWQKFIAKLQEIDTLEVPNWKPHHQLGHICKRYEEQYGNKYALSFRGAPSKCPEMYLVKQIIAMLSTENPKKIKDYIDWVWDQKIIPNKMKIRSLGFFTTPSFGNEYFLYKIEKAKITKTTELPPEYKKVADTLNLPVSTYGDLAFVKMALDQSPDSEARAPYRALLNNLVSIGFEPSVLNNLM